MKRFSIALILFSMETAFNQCADSGGEISENALPEFFKVAGLPETDPARFLLEALALRGVRLTLTLKEVLQVIVSRRRDAEPPVGQAPYNPYHAIVQPRSRPEESGNMKDFKICLRRVVGSGPVAVKRAFEVLDVYKLGKVGRYNFQVSLSRDFNWSKSPDKIFEFIDSGQRGFFTLTDWQKALGSLS